MKPAPLPTCSASASDTSSDRRGRRKPTSTPRSATLLGALVALVVFAGGRSSAASVTAPSAASTPARSEARATGKIFLTAEEALALAFPKCEVARATFYLTPAQLERSGELAGEPIDAAIARPWTATRDGRLVGTAYLDTHKVRTLSETLFVVVDPEGRVSRIEILSFAEPQEYVPRGNWYGQFVGRRLDDELRLKGAIRPVAGASLTAVATTSAVRRVLAVHRTLGESPPKEHGGSSRP